MNKLRMQTLNGVQDNIDKIAALFPNCITERKDNEGKVTLAIDFDKLRQELSSEIVEGREERYQFTWPDKKKAILLANSPINATLRPCRGESVDFDNTQNLYIEGDNLDVLKCLKETYLGKVKMIYIDPPYNTGNDFVYEDDFAESTTEYLANSGQYDEQGNRLVTNSESNGRFHTDWLNMIYPRLKVARDLLTEDGVIFISIDDNEVENLAKICDELYGISNCVGRLTVIVKPEGRRYGSFAKCHENCLVYVKDIAKIALNEIEVEGSSFQYYDEIGGFNLKGLRNRNVKAFNSLNRPNLRYPFYVDINNPDINNLYKVKTVETHGYLKVEASIIDGLKSVWRWGKETAELKKEQLVGFKGPDGNIRIFQKERKLTQTAKTVWSDINFISNKGTKEVLDLLGRGVFDFPKPSSLLKQMIQIGTNNDSLILDFFSGSATAAHAVMQLNAEDGGKRKFIMVQLPELTDEKSEAYKAGYKTICEIGKERVRRAGLKIKEEFVAKQQEDGLFPEQEEKKQTIDIGFRVLKLDSSNMEDIYYSPAEYNQNDLFAKTVSVKSDRTSEDLLFQVMLELGATLDSKIEQIEVEGKTIYNVATNYLITCFDNEINDSIVTAIAKMQPQYAVFRDSSMADDSTATNFEQIFKTYSPNTTTKVL